MIYVFSDLHGNMEVYKKIKELIGDNFAIFLGDACDRNEDGYAIIKDLLPCSNVVYLKGNHEDLFVKAAKAYINMCNEAGVSTRDMIEEYRWNTYRLMMEDMDLCLYAQNGGMPTFNDWLIDGCPMDIIDKLENLSIAYQAEIGYGDGRPTKIFDMCHAGVPMSLWDTEEEDAFLWDRTHFDELWNPDSEETHILIHGHTPVEYISNYTEHFDGSPIAYNNKIDIDTGGFYTDNYYVYELTNDEFIKI